MECINSFDARAASRMAFSLVAALATRLDPPLTSSALCSISAFTSLEACAADCARRRTSTATTAKPLPASPARAASTDALSASKLVWKAMSSIMPMILEILPDELVIFSIASVASAITCPPSSAVRVTTLERWLASCARSALLSTVVANCSMAAEVSSIVAACLVVRSDRSLAPERISLVAVLRVPEVARNCPTTSLSFSATALVSDLSCARAP